jgi:hypothetical protein
LDFLTISFLFLVVTFAFLKKTVSNFSLEIRPQSDTAFRALLPSAKYPAEWSGGVWQPAADSNGRLARFLKNLARSHYCQEQAATSQPASSN